MNKQEIEETAEIKKNYYIEPVEIEVYLKKLGKVRTIVKDMKIELIEVEPLDNEKSQKIFSHFKDRDEPIDLVEIQNIFPEMITKIYDSYYSNMELYEKLSMLFKLGLTGSSASWRTAIYFTELMLKYEPTIAATRYIGNFNVYNLNYLIIKLNEAKEQFLLEDSTVAFLIKRRNTAYEGQEEDRQFNKLVELWEHHRNLQH